MDTECVDDWVRFIAVRHESVVLVPHGDHCCDSVWVYEVPRTVTRGDDVVQVDDDGEPCTVPTYPTRTQPVLCAIPLYVYIQASLPDGAVL